MASPGAAASALPPGNPPSPNGYAYKDRALIVLFIVFVLGLASALIFFLAYLLGGPVAVTIASMFLFFLEGIYVFLLLVMVVFLAIVLAEISRVLMVLFLGFLACALMILFLVYQLAGPVAIVIANMVLFLVFTTHAAQYHARTSSSRWAEPWMDASVISALPAAFRYKREHAATGWAQCAICLELVKIGEAVRRLPSCGHLFHAECIDEWLRAHATCPMCRAAVGAAVAELPV